MARIEKKQTLSTNKRYNNNDKYDSIITCIFMYYIYWDIRIVTVHLKWYKIQCLKVCLILK